MTGYWRRKEGWEGEERGVGGNATWGRGVAMDSEATDNGSVGRRPVNKKNSDGSFAEEKVRRVSSGHNAALPLWVVNPNLFRMQGLFFCALLDMNFPSHRSHIGVDTRFL